MTDELLGKIFHHLCERGPLPLRHLLFVSRRFYSATVNNAHLWTTISLDSPFFHHFRQWPGQGNRFIEHCLLRSDSLPLCLFINCSGLTTNGFIFLLYPLETFAGLGWKGIQRCTSLLMWNADNYIGMLHRFMDLLPESLPSLKYVSLSRLDDSLGGFQFPNCPVLERVEMFDNRLSTPHLLGNNFRHVTTFCFGKADSWARSDLNILSLFPVLRDLTLFTRDTRPFDYIVRDRKSVV